MGKGKTERSLARGGSSFIKSAHKHLNTAGHHLKKASVNIIKHAGKELRKEVIASGTSAAKEVISASSKRAGEEIRAGGSKVATKIATSGRPTPKMVGTAS